MHRFYLPPAQCHPPVLTLTGGEAHHARDVLRLGRGDEVSVLDGAGRVFHCTVDTVGRREVTLAVVRFDSAAAPLARVTLLQAVPKGKIMESIIQKATELGTARIIPLISERVVMKLDEAGALDKAEKWQAVAVEAIKQCGQPWLPEVAAPVSLPAFLAQGEAFDLALVGSLQGDGWHVRQCFQTYEAQHARRPQTVGAWIGP